MPTAGWLRRVDLPVDAAGRSYIDPPNLDQILDQFLNWRGNVNGGGYLLSNVVLNSDVSGVQTPWAQHVNAAGYQLQNLPSIRTQSSTLNIYPAANPTAVDSMQLVLREQTGNAAYGLSIGMLVISGDWRGAIQMTNGGSPYSLLLNPSGGNVGIGTTGPTAKLAIQGGSTPGGITGLLLERSYNAIGDSMDIVFGTQDPSKRGGRISFNAVGGGEGGIIFYCQTANGDGYSQEAMRLHGNKILALGRPVYADANWRLQMECGPNYHLFIGNDGTGVTLQTLDYGATARQPLKFLASKAMFGDFNVGIGTDNPAERLHIHHPSNYCKLKITGSTNNSTSITIADTVRQWEMGINVAGIGLGYWILWNNSSGHPLIQCGDADIKLWLNGSMKTLSLDGNGFVKAA